MRHIAAPMLISLAVVATVAMAAPPVAVRSIFLNGVDISSAKSQDLHNVDLHINENGDVFIIAPHYQVNEEDTYVPLSKYVQGLNQPQHRPAQKLPPAGKGSPSLSPGAGITSATAAPAAGSVPIPKAGEPMSNLTSPPATAQLIPSNGGAPGSAGATMAPAAAPAATSVSAGAGGLPEALPDGASEPPLLPTDDGAKPGAGE